MPRDYAGGKGLPSPGTVECWAFSARGISERAAFPSERYPFIADMSVNFMRSGAGSPINRALRCVGDMQRLEMIKSARAIRRRHFIGYWIAESLPPKLSPPREDGAPDGICSY